MKSRDVTLGEVCEIKQGKYLSPGQMETQPTQEAIVPVVGGNGVLGYTTTSTFSFPLPLVTCRGSKCGLMQWAEPPTWISNNAMAIYFKEGLGDNFFLYQYLVQSSFDDVTTGSAQPQITVSNLSLKKIVLPEIGVQRAISQLMMKLEKKIEINSLISQTLEDVAQTIFKSWFIDFDPVKAKMAGEKPVGMDDVTAALFPDSMEDSELGPIPSGWALSQIGEEVECVGGSTPSTSNSEFWDGDIFWTTPKDLSRQAGLITTSSERRITSKGLQRISSGILPTYSVLMSSRAPIGYLSISAVPIAINQGFIALRRTPRFAPLWLLFWLQRNMPVIKNRAGGGTFAEISKTAFKSIPLLVPDEALLHKFEEISQPILLQLTALTLQNRELASLRDSLLPRLISGELQIPEEMLVS
jgi:type I restriction enzyme, S subunit